MDSDFALKCSLYIIDTEWLCHFLPLELTSKLPFLLVYRVVLKRNQIFKFAAQIQIQVRVRVRNFSHVRDIRQDRVGLGPRLVFSAVKYFDLTLVSSSNITVACNRLFFKKHFRSSYSLRALVSQSGIGSFVKDERKCVIKCWFSTPVTKRRPLTVC